ncbi:MAG: helix-hairpin-helix domain-containing protein [Coriobacteriales bacterium]|nr:helix-hairpin-helix domain-containing protein [Coriobacteriales bacterium]
MAQRKRPFTQKARLLARRYGIGGRQAAAAVLGFVLLMGAIGLLRLRAPSNFVVERGDQTSASATQGEQKKEGDTSARKQESVSAQSAAAPPARVIVHVDGAVVAPGVYELQGEDLRINDAVARAGGLRADADTSGMNLAQALGDGEKVHVPAVGEEPVAETPAVTPSQGSATDSSATPAATGATGGLVNINTATVQDLMTLTGVGEATAEAIVQDREQNGAFDSARDLMRVTGIGEKKYAKLEGQICV